MKKVSLELVAIATSINNDYNPSIMCMHKKIEDYSQKLPTVRCLNKWLNQSSDADEVKS